MVISDGVPMGVLLKAFTINTSVNTISLGLYTCLSVLICASSLSFDGIKMSSVALFICVCSHVMLYLGKVIFFAAAVAAKVSKSLESPWF